MNNQNNKTLYRGSKWRKWDLQIHTYLDPNWRWPSGYPNGSDKQEERIKEFNSDFIKHCADISLEVVAITDHNTGEAIDGLIKENDQQGYKITILPGVEVVSTEGTHILVIFNPDKQLKNRWSTWRETIDHFLTAIFTNQPRFEEKNGKNTPSNAPVPIDTIIQKAKEFSALAIFPHVLSDGGIFNCDARTRKRVLELCNILDLACSFSDLQNKISEINNKLKGQQFNPEYFAYINTSDSRRISDIGCKFTWIKANPTFEGLKQIIYEPKDRVRIQEDNPEPLKSSYSINSIKINDANINKNLSIKTIEIPLNHNLVAVIGGKGSGKTALLDLIANCYQDKIDPSNKNSFVSRIFSEGQNLNTNIEFLNKEKFSKKLSEGKIINDSDIEYIPQGQIENKIGNTKEFHNFLQNLIFKSDKVINAVVYLEYQENENEKKEIKSKIEILNQEIFTIETQLKPEDIDNIDRQLKLKETERKDIQERINLIKKLFTKGKLKEIDTLQSKLSAFKDRRVKLLDLSRLIKDVIDKLVELENLNKNLETIKILADELELKDADIQFLKYADIKNQIENIEEEIKQEVVGINKNIEQTQDGIEKLQKDKKDYVVLLNKLKEIDIAINSLKSKQKNIEELKKSLSERIEKRWALYEQLLNTYLLLRKEYKEIIDVFSKDAYEILTGIEFKSSLIFDFENFAETGEDILDLRTVRESKTQKVSLLESELLKNIINAIREIIKPKSNNSEIVKLTETIKQKIAELLKIKKSTRTNEHLYEWLFGDYLSLNTETYFKGTYLEKLSLGQKCTVLLKVYLAQGENTILIDQPDDNLDNEFIMEELVPAIRKAKSNRQVIIASNNANVVINSDAEQIIVAEYENGEIHYVSGSIEEPITKEKAIHILEGGQEAFEAREKKYNFKIV